MEQQGKTENNGNSRLETGNIWKLMLSLSIPSIIAQLVGILYNMVDRMFIGRIENGTTAMAALSVSLPLITCITAFTRLVGIGGAPLCAIKMGKKDQRGAEEILGVSFAALITVGVILTVVILVFQRPILTLFGADPTTLDMACDYVSIYALGTVFVMISLGMNSYITTQGFARTGMCTVLIGAILNIIFDAFFINYLHMGVKGAAIATIIANGYGETPIDFAIASAMGAISTAVAVLEINNPIVAHIMNRHTIIKYGPYPPPMSMSPLTIKSTPPVFCSARAKGIIPTIRMMLGQ